MACGVLVRFSPFIFLVWSREKSCLFMCTRPSFEPKTSREMFLTFLAYGRITLTSLLIHSSLPLSFFLVLSPFPPSLLFHLFHSLFSDFSLPPSLPSPSPPRHLTLAAAGFLQASLKRPSEANCVLLSTRSKLGPISSSSTRGSLLPDFLSRILCHHKQQ